MSTTSQSRWKLVEPPPPPQKPSRRRRDLEAARESGFRRGFLAGGATGLAFAVAIAGVAFVTTPRTRAPGPQAAATNGQPEARTGNQAGILHVKASHIGDLRVRIEVQALSRTAYDPITMARIVAYTDMVSMPMSHRNGPIPLMEVPGRKGVYSAITKVPMMGEYDIKVELQQPLQTEAHERLTIETVPAAR